jgi:hypothetical protein
MNGENREKKAIGQDDRMYRIEIKRRHTPTNTDKNVTTEARKAQRGT